MSQQWSNSELFIFKKPIPICMYNIFFKRLLININSLTLIKYLCNNVKYYFNNPAELGTKDEFDLL